MRTDFAAEPFTLAVPDAVLADLRQRLTHTRLPAYQPVGPAWRYGTSLAYMRDVVAHWRDAYDWRKWEARINGFSHYKSRIDGKAVHFILERGSGPAPILPRGRNKPQRRQTPRGARDRQQRAPSTGRPNLKR